MTTIVWPVDAIAMVPENTGRMLRQTLSPLLAGATAARPLGARSGVRPGTSPTTVTATGTTWTIGLHAGILDLESSGLAGPYAYAVNVAETGAVTAAHATLARVDIVWLRLDDPAESDGSAAPVVVAGYTAGTGGGFGLGGGVPATPARCMVLATIQVPLSGGGSPTVIWAAPYCVAAGGVLPVPGASAYPASPYMGQVVDDAALGGQWRYNGTAWFPISGAMPGGRVVRDGSAFTIPATTWQPLSSFWVVDQPAIGIAALSYGVWTITTPGVYDVEAGCHIITAAITFELIVKLNNTAASAVGAYLADSATTTAIGGAASVKGRLRLNAGDTLMPAVYTSGSAVWSNTAAQSEARASFFGMRFVEPLR